MLSSTKFSEKEVLLLNDREFVGLKNKIQAKRDALVIKQSEMQKNKQRLEELKAEIIKHGTYLDYKTEYFSNENASL